MTAMTLTELTRRLQKLERKIAILEGHLETMQLDAIRAQRFNRGS